MSKRIPIGLERKIIKTARSGKFSLHGLSREFHVSRPAIREILERSGVLSPAVASFVLHRESVSARVPLPNTIGDYLDLHMVDLPKPGTVSIPVGEKIANQVADKVGVQIRELAHARALDAMFGDIEPGAIPTDMVESD